MWKRYGLIVLVVWIVARTGLYSQSLYTSRHTSAVTYLYRITTQEAYKLARKGLHQVGEEMLHSRVDSFLTDSLYRKNLPPGQYLQVKAVSEQLQVAWFPVSALRPVLLDNKRDFQLALYDTLGRTVSDAHIRLDGRPVAWDPVTQTYRETRPTREGVLEMAVAGDTLIWRVSDTRQARPITFGRRLLYSPPLRWVWVPVFNTFYVVKNAINNNWWGVLHTINPQNWYTVRWVRGKIRWPDAPQVSVILSQPMYRLGDTVQLSAFCYRSSGRPYKQPLTLRVRHLGVGPALDRQLAELVPDYPGHYRYSWVLDDSLPVVLDHVYELSLYKNRSRGKADFVLADYELTTSTWQLTTSSPVHSLREPVTLTLEGRDDNNLMLRQARYEVYLIPALVKRLHTEAIVMPDTLWRVSGSLLTDKPTQIVIPDSIFLPADVAYQVYAVLHTASQERQEKLIQITHLHEQGRLVMAIVGDSLEVKYLEEGVSMPREVELNVQDYHKRTLFSTPLTTPAHIPIHPLGQVYTARSAGILPEIYSSEAKPLVAAWRSHDSLYLQVDHPGGQPYWYHVYRHNREIVRGQASGPVQQIIPASYKGSYTVTIQQPGVSAVVQDYQVPSVRHALILSQTHPPIANPGQTIRVSLTARSPKGKPLPGVAITSWALTRKFDRYTPPEPLGWTPRHQNRNAFNSYKPDNTWQGTAQRLIDYPYWASLMGLDSIVWYQFLYPPTGLYATYIPDQEDITQGAIFISDSGRLVPAAIVWQDERPVFFLQTSAEQRYVFHAEPGYHNVKVRTAQHEIYIDSVYYQPGHKLILCLDLNHPPVKVIVKSAQQKLSYDELSSLQTYLMRVMPVQNNMGTPGFDYIRQGQRVWSLTRTGEDLLGPLYRDKVEYVRPGLSSVTTQFESGYQWQYEPPAIKMKYLPAYPAINFLSVFPAQMSVYDRVLTAADIQNRWSMYQESLSAHAVWYDDQKKTQPGHVRVVQQTGVRCKQLWIFRQDDPMFLRVYQPGKNELHDFEPGIYDFLWIGSDSTYRLLPGVRLSQGHTTYVDASQIPEQVADRFFREMFRRGTDIINSPGYIHDQKTAIREIYHQAWHTRPVPGNWKRTSGQVTDAFGTPLEGVAVIVKSPESGPTLTGALTDAQGYFSLNIPPQAVLVVQYIGYEQVEIWYQGQPFLPVSLQPMQMALDEVVIVGYSTQMKREVTGAVAGLQIRGARTNHTQYFIDGVRVRGDLSTPSSDTLLRPAALTLPDIITEAGPPDTTVLSEPEFRIRSRFRDRAWWQPLLITDDTGAVSFQATLPDDITQWRTFAQGVAPGRYAGQTEGSLRAIRQRVAQLYGPRFMIEGDSACWIGQYRDYTATPVPVSVSFAQEDSLIYAADLTSQAEHVDSLSVIAPQGDSLHLTYAYRETGRGDRDGETRVVPLYPQGTIERAGIFRDLYGAGEITWRPDSQRGPVYLQAYANTLPFIWLEMNRLREYAYLCNEQAASKLRGLLLEQRLCQQECRQFEDGAAVERLIRRLLRDELPKGGWGWWPGNETVSPWITAHVTQALLRARDQGWTVKWDSDDLRERAILETSGAVIASQHLPWMEVLIRLKAVGAATQPLNRLAVQDSLPLYAYIQLQRLRAEAGLPVRVDSVIALARTGAMGYMYWADYTQQPYIPSQNSLQASLDAYDLIQLLRPADAALPLIRRYWLAQYSPRGWANTYETIRICERLADVALISSRPGAFKAQLAWQEDGRLVQVDSFPHTAILPAHDTLTLTKTGENPVYLTLYQTWQEPHPARVDSTFSVKTWFSDSTDWLKAGTPVELRVTVQVRKHSEYVLLEIPIPAGCSYDTRRPAPRVPEETWRETFRYQTSIACLSLRPGTYTFTIPLLPRYTGRYTLNPATAALMYAPLNLGRNEGRTVWVR
ncbi:MAG: carboxypeptidase regulatory-like domain-containing protein [Bacteroidia bacterium]|nr:carboxypeptidase regulatory-like domain-containing protein [Bacteroidia bacterium]